MDAMNHRMMPPVTAMGRGRAGRQTLGGQKPKHHYQTSLDRSHRMNSIRPS